MANRERKQNNKDFSTWELPDLLRYARTKFDKDEKSVVAVMRWISGIDDWTRSKCEKFLLSIIEEFVDREEDKKLLKYVIGLVDETKRNKYNATSRRQAYRIIEEKSDAGKSYESDMKALTYKENVLLDRIAMRLERGKEAGEYKIDPSTGILQRIEEPQTTSKESTPSEASSADSLSDPQPGLSNNAGNLRLRNDYFSGRAEELKAIKQNFDQGVYIQILHGMGGMGKTQVAIQYAYQNLQNYNFVWMINGSSEGTIIDDCCAFLLTQGFKPDQLHDEAIPVLFSDYLNHHQNWLLIIDNCNYYGDNEMLAVLKRYIPNQAPTGQILITSRTIQKLHKAAILEIGQMDEESSVAFVMDRSGCNDEMHARELARMLKYYPLAMETAAAYIENTPNGSFSRYIDLLEENGIGLLNEKYDIQDYDQTVQEIWNISIHNIERYGETSIERHCIRPCLWYCSMLNSSHIDLTLFAYLKHLFVYSNEAIEITDIEERLNNRDDTLIEEIAPLPIVCQNELSRNKLYSFLVKYSLLHAESGNYLYMHPVLQKVVFDSFNDPNGKLDMCWDLFSIHFSIWERSEAYHILNNGLCPLFIKLPLFSISDQTEHIYSLLCNIEVLLKESETNEEDEEWLKIYQLLYSGFGCYRLFLRGDYPQIQNDLYTLIDHFYESANNIDWHDHKNYCSFAASIYLYAIRYLYLKKPNVTAKYINAYIDIVRIMIENSPDDIFSNGRISLEMTVLFNINCLQLVFAYWTVNGNYKFSITGLESLLQRIKTILFHGDKTEILYFGNVYTPDILDDFHMVYRAWEAKDYRLLPEHWRYSHFETEKAFMERLKKEYGIK